MPKPPRYYNIEFVWQHSYKIQSCGLCGKLFFQDFNEISKSYIDIPFIFQVQYTFVTYGTLILLQILNLVKINYLLEGPTKVKQKQNTKWLKAKENSKTNQTHQENKLINEYHCYILNDNEHDNLFLQHCFELHQSHFKVGGFYPRNISFGYMDV